MTKNLESQEIRFVKEIRDPIYKYIHITNIEQNVIDHWMFQRLDRILQMPTAHFVYPSGKYSRKTHSLGTMHLINKAILKIIFFQSGDCMKDISPLLWGERVVKKRETEKLDNLNQELRSDWWNDRSIDEIVQSVRLCGLLHDIGHGPFSHSFEDVCKSLKKEGRIDTDFNHETMGREVINKMFEELKMKPPFDGDCVNEILKSDGSAPLFLHELISGHYDCDKLDYLMRDAYHTGATEYGGIDSERILSGFRVKAGKLCISESAIHSLMNSFRAIQSMYCAVYYHKTSRIFDFMMADALENVPEFIEEIISSVDTFLRYDDGSFIYEIKNRVDGNNEYSKAWSIFREFLTRKKTYKMIFEYPLRLGIRIQSAAVNDLDILEKTLYEKADGIKIKVDYRPDIRPVGVSLEDICNWLREERIYTPSTCEIKKLEDVSRVYFEELTKYFVMFRVYGNREQLKESPHTSKEIERMGKAELKRIETEYKELT